MSPAATCSRWLAPRRDARPTSRRTAASITKTAWPSSEAKPTPVSIARPADLAALKRLIPGRRLRGGRGTSDLAVLTTPRASPLSVRRLGDAPQAAELLRQAALAEGLRPHPPDSRPAQDLEPGGREPFRALAGAQIPGVPFEQRLDLLARIPQALRSFPEMGHRRRGPSTLYERALDLLPPGFQHRGWNLAA